MKKYLNAFFMCFTMFCAIPSPFHNWDEESRPLMTLFLPFVGAWIGLLWALAAIAISYFNIPLLVGAIILTAFPIIITGGMHMDGYLDVVDAVKSWRDIEEKRRILKDPHVGSFAVISAVIMILTQFALFASASETANPFTLIIIPTGSRCMAAICVTLLRPLSVSEYSGAYRKGIKKSHIVFLFTLFAVTVAAGFFFLGKYGFASLAVCAGYLLFLFRAFRSLDGMSGDISGYSLVFGELCGIAVYALI
ncbi:MAG: adenosylcobinamide-GDP ribazoletransferase [Clostridia bacterium]|nr:adenosylcobinamide-GDP ribazoletransferase [Clostridia bacterium]